MQAPSGTKGAIISLTGVYVCDDCGVWSYGDKCSKCGSEVRQ